MILSRKLAYIHPQLIQSEKETYRNSHFSLLCSQWLVTSLFSSGALRDEARDAETCTALGRVGQSQTKLPQDYQKT